MRFPRYTLAAHGNSDGFRTKIPRPSGVHAWKCAISVGGILIDTQPADDKTISINE